MAARGSGSTSLKVLVTGSLVMLSVIPLTMISGLVSERAGRRDAVRRETAASWGGHQVVGGIALSVPFELIVRNGDRQDVIERRAAFLPETLQIDAELSPEIRERSIFPVVVYRVRAKVRGEFAFPDFARVSMTPDRIRWERSTLSIDVRDMRGVTALAPVVWAGQPVPLEPEGEAGPFALALRGVVPLSPPDSALPSAAAQRPRIPFSFELSLAGTERLAFLPAGAVTDVTVRSPWAHPGFAGAFLPEAHRIDATGFSAKWHVLSFARAYPQVWTIGIGNDERRPKGMTDSEFGVTLVQTVDVYQQTERAVKYGLLFVVLTFTVFFLWELLGGLRLHPIQYLLVGMALVIFYLLLLSISEHASFVVAYAIAATATIVLVGGYAGAILSAGVRGGLAVGALLSGLYGLLYVLLQLEDLALLVGATTVFAALALVMYLTRRVDWYDALSRQSATK